MPKILREVYRDIGQLTIGPQLELNNGQSGDILEWRPRPGFRDHFSPDFRLRMNSLSSGGMRVLAPSDGDFPLQPFRGGIGVLKSCGALSLFDDFDHNGLFALFQKGMHAREYSGRQFVRASDLRERGKLSNRNPRGILPDDLGLDANTAGPSWTIKRLLKEGRNVASEFGIPRPTQSHVIRLGFLAAARRNPLWLRSSETASLIRNAFFALPPTPDRPSRKIRTFICDQLAGAMGDRLDSIEEFNSILIDEKGDILRRIAKIKGPNGETVARELVREVILDLGWQSFLFCGTSIEAQMRAFEASMPNPLAGSAQRLYELFYYRQPMLGKLPLVMLKDRLGFVKEAVLEVVAARGSRESYGVLHRMLDFYAQLIGGRRDADKQYQRIRHSKVAVSPIYDNTQAQATRSSKATTQIKQIVQELLIRRGTAKETDFKGDWDAKVVDQRPDKIRIQTGGLGDKRKLNRIHTFNAKQFAEVAREIRDKQDFAPRKGAQGTRSRGSRKG